MISSIIRKFNKMRYQRYLTACKSKGMKIGENTCIMPGCYFDDDFCSLISIGNNCTLSNDVFILAHDASMYKFLKFAKIARVKIHDNCFIGARAMILPGVSIGPNAIVGAGSVVVKDVPSNSVVGGNPAKAIKNIDEFLTAHKERFDSKQFIWLEKMAENSSATDDTTYVVKMKDQEVVR